MLGARGRDFYCLQDSALAAQNLALVAHANGLGTCWVGSFDEEKAREVLEIPDSLRPVAIVPCGYPANNEEPTPDRSTLARDSGATLRLLPSRAVSSARSGSSLTREGGGNNKNSRHRLARTTPQPNVRNFLDTTSP
jgi:hypothetical protein